MDSRSVGAAICLLLIMAVKKKPFLKPLLERLENFIETEVVEKIINDIPEDMAILTGRTITPLRVKLRDKYLTKQN